MRSARSSRVQAHHPPLHVGWLRQWTRPRIGYATAERSVEKLTVFARVESLAAHPGQGFVNSVGSTPPYLDWAVPFLRALRAAGDDEGRRGRRAIRALVNDGALPSVCLPAVHQMLQISFDLARKPGRRRYPGAYERTLNSAKVTVRELNEVIRLRREIARRSVELNRRIRIGHLPSEVLRHILDPEGKLAGSISQHEIELLRRQPRNDISCADILEQKELPLWQRLAARNLLRVTQKFLLYFLHRYLTLRTGSPHTQQIVDLLNAAIAAVPSAASKNSDGVQRTRPVSLKARRRGKPSADPQTEALNAGYIKTVVSRFPSEYPHACAAVEQWAKREAAYGPWQSHRDVETYASTLDREFDQEIAALMRSRRTR